mgnify:CR=1 FL=1
MAVNESFWRFFDLTDSRRPPAEMKLASELSDQNPPGATLYEIIFVLNSNFYENIIAHYLLNTYVFYVIVPKKHVQMTKIHESIVSQVSSGSLCVHNKV